MNDQGLQRVEELCNIVYGTVRSSPTIVADAHKTLLALQTSATFLPQIKYLTEKASSTYVLLYAINSLTQIVTKDWNSIRADVQQDLVSFLLTFLANTQSMSNPTSGTTSGNQQNEATGESGVVNGGVFSDKQVGSQNRALNVKFITKSMIKCLCRVIKQGWLQNESFRGIFAHIKQLLRSGSKAHCVLGLQILADLVAEFDLTAQENVSNSIHSSSVNFNSYGYGIVARYDTSKRMLSQAFREQNGLSQCFMLALEYTQQAQQDGDRDILKEALNTLHACLTYDFVGTGQESNDESVSCLYIPTEWADHIARAKSLRLIFQIYQMQWLVDPNGSQPPPENGSAAVCLQILTLLVSVRRSVFDIPSRREYLVALLEDTTVLMQTKTGLANSEECLHHFCRLLAAIKNHFTLVDLTQPDQYHVWLRELAQFTSDVLRAWNSVSNRTVHYLIKLWASLVLPTPYLQVRDGYRHSNNSAKTPAYLMGLDSYVPEIVRVFIQTRCEMSAASAIGAENTIKTTAFGSGGNFTGSEDDLLDEEGLLLDTLAPVAVLVRFKYLQTFKEIEMIYTQSLSSYSSILSKANNSGGITNLDSPSSQELLAAQARLSLLNYLVGSIIGSHVSRVSAAIIEHFDQTNADLASLVFSLINVTNNNISNVSGLLSLENDASFKLELSCLYFVRCFQNLYIESRARIEADNMESSQNAPLGGLYGLVNFGYPNFMYEGLDTLRGRDARGRAAKDGSNGDSMAEETDQQENRESKLSRLQEEINSKFGASVLDMALQKVFSLLSKVNSGTVDGSQRSVNSNRVVLTERALSVLHQLSIGVTVVHAGRSFTPKLMSSGKLLLESKTIQGLLTTPESRDFPLLSSTVHFKSRTFLMSTLSKLLFTQVRNIPSSGITLDLKSFIDHSNSINLETSQLFAEINRIIFDNSADLNKISAGKKSTSNDMESDRSTEVVIVSGDGLITLNNLSAMASIQGSQPSEKRDSIFDAEFYARRQLSKQEVADILFVQFMKPLDKKFELIFQFLNSYGDLSNVPAEANQNPVVKQKIQEARDVILVLLRDMKGILTSCSISREYELFFSWLFPQKIKLVSLVSKVLWTDDEVISNLFKFLKDLVYNKGSRINFGNNYNLGNKSGTLLFKEACTIVSSYIEQKLTQFDSLKAKEAQSKESIIKENISNENILNDLSLITGIKNAANAPANTSDQMSSRMKSAQDQGGLLSMATLQEAVMNLTSDSFGNAGSASLSLTDPRKALGSRNKNAMQLDFGACGVGVTLQLATLPERTVRIMTYIVMVLFRLFSGRYANLACFEVYSDDSLNRTIAAVLKMSFTAEPYEIVSYPKFANCLVELIYALCSNQRFLLDLIKVDSGLFSRIIATLAEVINIEDNYSKDNTKAANLEDLASSAAKVGEAENSYKYKYSGYGTIIGKAASALHHIVELRCRAVAFNFVSSDGKAGRTNQAAEAKFNTAFSFLSLELRTSLAPSYRPSLSSSSTQSISHETLSTAAKCFAMHNQTQPNLFPEVLTLILSKLFVFPVDSEAEEGGAQEDSMVSMSAEQRSSTARSGRSKYSSSADFMFRGNVKKIAKNLLPLILTSPHTFEQFKNKFVRVHSQNAKKRSLIEGKFRQLFEVLQPAISNEASGSIGPNPAYFDPLLRQNDAFAREMCKLAKEISRA